MKEALLPLDQHLIEHPYDFNFFQAVRLLSCILPSRPGVGESAKPGDEIVRFGVRQSLEFPASQIHALDPEDDPARMIVAFFGLTGFLGVLPHHYTEHIILRAAVKDYSMAEFLDLFNHRLLSLFYRAWEKHQFPVLYQLAAVRETGTDSFTRHLLALLGLGTDGLQGRMPVRDESLLRYAGLLVQAPRSASALCGILRDYFGLEVEIEQFQGGWYQLAQGELCNLYEPDLRNQLGVGAIAGDAVWDPHAGFRVKLGPLPLARFLAFLPGEKASTELVALVRFYCGDFMHFDWQPALRAAEAPWCRIGDESAAGPRLGWCAWLKTEEFSVDAEDAVFEAAA